MNDFAVPRISKWPFLGGDLLLLVVAAFVVWQGALPLALGEIVTLGACVALGAALGVTPFVLEYRYLSKLAQVERLQQALLQVHKVETIGRQIASATACWQAVQDDASKSLESARQINESMTAEAHAFQTFLEKANDSERQHLRLEVDKLRRAELDWSRVLVRILDHVFALFQAAERSQQPALIEQLGNFQHACRDSALRVGLVPFEAKPGDPFDPEVHQWDQDDVQPPPGSVVGETRATGYRFQGQTIRRALVSLHQEPTAPEPSPLSIREITQHREHAHQADTQPESDPSAVQPDPAPPAPNPWPGFDSPEGPEPEDPEPDTR